MLVFGATAGRGFRKLLGSQRRSTDRKRRRKMRRSRSRSRRRNRRGSRGRKRHQCRDGQRCLKARRQWSTWATFVTDAMLVRCLGQGIPAWSAKITTSAGTASATRTLGTKAPTTSSGSCGAARWHLSASSDVAAASLKPAGTATIAASCAPAARASTPRSASSRTGPMTAWILPRPRASLMMRSAARDRPAIGRRVWGLSRAGLKLGTRGR
mmetsp:Transcript_114706/g.319457  ORF Transcript_114706/g.319457 Transcript_114706/m.319457 type:complete len:212 (+) Transcript_114706:748-1383(+)